MKIKIVNDSTPEIAEHIFRVVIRLWRYYKKHKAVVLCVPKTLCVLEDKDEISYYKEILRVFESVLEFYKEDYIKESEVYYVNFRKNASHEKKIFFVFRDRSLFSDDTSVFSPFPDLLKFSNRLRGDNRLCVKKFFQGETHFMIGEVPRSQGVGEYSKRAYFHSLMKDGFGTTRVRVNILKKIFVWNLEASVKNNAFRYIYFYHKGMLPY